MVKKEKNKNIHAAALGTQGGRARARKLSKRKLSEIGKKGAAARWGKKKPERGR